MSLSVGTAVSTLSSAATQIADARLVQRLSEMQSLLRDELRWVEQVLSEAAPEGAEPALSAARHLIAGGGKRVRPTAVMLSAACFGGIPMAAREMGVVVELVHNATLLHDDVIDEGMERRAKTTPRLLFSNSISVLAGDTLLVHSLQRTNSVAPELLPGLLETLQRLVAGEVVQLRGRGALDLSLETYEQILNDKTASLFRFATTSGAYLGGASSGEREALGVFGERIGMAFQLVDDVLDYVGEDSGKSICTDLKEGKVTLPLVLAVESDSSLVHQIRAIQLGDDDAVLELQQRVMSSGACDQVRARARSETQLALDALDSVPDCPARSLLTAVARQLVDRAS